MNASARLLQSHRPGGEALRVLSASGQLGYGIPEDALRRGMARAPHVIGCDMGSIDPGPYYLGAGVMAAPAAEVGIEEVGPDTPAAAAGLEPGAEALDLEDRPGPRARVGPERSGGADRVPADQRGAGQVVDEHERTVELARELLRKAP